MLLISHAKVMRIYRSLKGTAAKNMHISCNGERLWTFFMQIHWLLQLDFRENFQQHIAPLKNEFDWLRVMPQVDVPCAWLWCGWSDRYTRCWSNCCSSTAGKRWGRSGDHSQALRTSLSPGHFPPLDPRQVTVVFSTSKTEPAYKAHWRVSRF